MLATLATYLFAALVFLVLISALIFFHELGHYGVGRLFGIKVDRFSIGFGKAIWSRRDRNGTEWTLSRIPMGGFVKFAGDSGAASNPDAEALEQLKAEQGDVSDIFHFKPVWQRALVVLAGPVANFILAALLFAVAFLWVGTRVAEPRIGEVVAESPAALAGLQSGDVITRFDGKPIEDWREVLSYVSQRAETPIETTVLRDGRELTVTVSPRRITDKDFIGGEMQRGQFGIRLAEDVTIQDVRYGPLQSLAKGTAQVGEVIGATGRYIGRIFTGKENAKQLGSVLRIGTVTGKATVDIVEAEIPFGQKMRAFTVTMIQLAASISVALGFANLIPIPMLDGGHLVYYGYEAVAGKPLSQKKQEAGFRLGMAVLLALFLFLLFNDVLYIGTLSPS